MLPVRSVRSVWLRCPLATQIAVRPAIAPAIPAKAAQTQSRNVTSSVFRSQENQELTTNQNAELSEIDSAELERVVRDAKQRFRDTLPDDYLKPAEYELYLRLYGAPLRKTSPDDVGIPAHDNFEAKDAPEIGPFAHYDIQATEEHEEGDTRAYPPEQHESNVMDINYVEMVARSEREYNAMKKLEQDFKVAQAKAEQEQAELEAQEQEEAEFEALDVVYDEEIDPEDEESTLLESEPLRPSRLHKHTQDARFGISPGTVQLPHGRMVRPVTEALRRTHHKHLRLAAEETFGGPGLPDGPVTPQSMKTREMRPIPVNVNHRRMPPISADVVMAAYMPPVYASIVGILVELRKRLGTEWLRGLIQKYGDEGPRVLDVGGAGAGIIAWEQILFAEWQAMGEENLVAEDAKPKTRKSVIVGADLLRERLAKFLHNTSFLSRLPDYIHSVENADRVLDGPEQPQTRKHYDVIIASHQLLPAEEGHKRRAVLSQLWSLLNPDGGVLIIIEKAHPRGFEAVADARQRLLNDFLITPNSEPEQEDISGTPVHVKEPGMIVAPCTTQGKCPLYLVQGKAFGRKDFCYFAQRYIRPPYLQKILNAKHKNNDDVEFSYVAIQRGTTGPPGLRQGIAAAARALKGFEHDSTDYYALALPRNIRPPLKKRGHVTMDLCTPGGSFERWTVTKSFSKGAYHDARKIRWGDLWALGAKTRVENKVRLGRGDIVKDGGVKGRAARAAETKSLGAGKRPEVVNLQMNALGKAVPKQKPMKGYLHTKGGRHMAKSQAQKKIRDTEGELDKQLHDSVNRKL